jgi:SAM-dependent methyltransferase
MTSMASSDVSLSDRSDGNYCAVCRRVTHGGFSAGPGGRPNALCPRCGSLERHRFLSCLLGCVEPFLASSPLLVEVAPSPQTTPVLGRLQPRRLVSLDFDPAADGRKVDVRASLTDLPFATDSVDLLLCFHVLEHVPDDRRAISEISRVLGPGGIGVIQVPWRAGAETDEDPDLPAAERVLRFGQSDHVRYYGRDFDQRLRAGGLAVRRVRASALLGAGLCDWMRINHDNTIWVVQPGGGQDTSLELVRPNDLALAIQGLCALGAEARAEAEDAAQRLAQATLELAQAEQRVRRLRRRLRRHREESTSSAGRREPGVTQAWRTLTRPLRRGRLSGRG